jgi:UDP-N-acetylglucosamine--N-acetylmuramyl-(pentapeptide) pyrophosphoryl-undecaprenol N-acetylglucosamine transferase
VQFVWQTGSFYKNEIADALRRAGKPENLIVTDFIADMAAAYTVADLVISRAGAGSISEFCLLGKPVILVPSPNVAEDHQTKNALALVKKGAAVYIKDDEARQALIPRAIALVQEPLQLKELSDNILPLAKPNAAMDIAREVLKLAQS